LNFSGSTKYITDVYVSTDCPEIKKVVLDLDIGVQVIDRPAEFATDEASTESVMIHFMNNISFDLLVTIQASSPLLTSEDLDQALDSFRSKNLDSMLSAVRCKRFFWNDDATPINYDPMHRPRRQDFAGTLMENGAFYVTRREILEKHQCRLGGKMGIYEMPESTAVEIDEPSDWELVSRLLAGDKSA
jgi:CMP-N-acetylneuraminic acid synthetase